MGLAVAKANSLSTVFLTFLIFRWGSIRDDDETTIAILF